MPPVFRNVRARSGVQHLQNVEWETKRRVPLDERVVELIAPVAIVDGKKRSVDLRNAPAVYGLGLLEAISDTEIRTIARKQEFLEFGVKGIAGTACERLISETCDTIGRFGWKASVPDLTAQTRSALARELGIHEPVSDLAEAGAEADYDRLVTELAEYMKMLAVPARRPESAPEHAKGARLFEDVGCVMCHKPSWRTSEASGTDKRLRGQRIYPFTDMLLHYMREGLADSNGDRLSRYWRTPALWGIGMQSTVSDKAGYLHDGRARDFTEAILWHGGEVSYAVSRSKAALSAADRASLIKFLSSL